MGAEIGSLVWKEHCGSHLGRQFRKGTPGCRETELDKYGNSGGQGQGGEANGGPDQEMLPPEQSWQVILSLTSKLRIQASPHLPPYPLNTACVALASRLVTSFALSFGVFPFVSIL